MNRASSSRLVVLFSGLSSGSVGRALWWCAAVAVVALLAGAGLAAPPPQPTTPPAPPPPATTPPPAPTSTTLPSTTLPSTTLPSTTKPAGSALASLKEVGAFETVPVGIAASKSGRVFLAFSRAIDPAQPFSVAELKDGKAVPWPPGLAQEDGAPSEKRLLAVQALTVDADDKLWILDCAKVGQKPVPAGAVKLVVVDLKTDKVERTLTLPAAVAGGTSFINDLVVDLAAGAVYLTDASPEGPNGLVVLDLKTGEFRRRLHEHPSTKPDATAPPAVHGTPLVQREGPNAGKPFLVGADGIALSADGKHLYYSPLSSRKLYRVSTSILRDVRADDAAAAKAVEDLGDKGFAADGLLGDAAGNVFVTDFEHDAIHRRGTDGKLTLVVQDPRLGWPDSMALKDDGTLMFTTTQIHLSPRFQGSDKRVKPFKVWSVKTDAKPLRRK